ncbi:MAG: hypothetical protein QOK19_2213 [Solirubrobacteraceae bacterium]|nr:hypothetical protein [Solirubrobacteraceae bacterium]
MSRARRGLGLSALVCGLLVGISAVPAGAGGAPRGLGALDAVTVETSLGPVTCRIDPAHEPAPQDVTTVTHGSRMRVSILDTGALLCDTTLGEVEVSGANLPWHLVIDTAGHTAIVHGSPRLALQAQLVALPGVHCLYQAGHTAATLVQQQPLTVALSVARIKLNKRMSNALCPTFGPVSVSLTLP